MMSAFLSGLSSSPIGIMLVIGCLLLLVVFVRMVSRRTETEKTETGKVEDGKPWNERSEHSVGDNGRGEAPSPEVVAAITAAILAIWEGENGFVVRRIKRVSNAPAWNRAGRDEQIYSRL